MSTSISILMKTYLTAMFSTEGGLPSTVVDRLHMLGFKPTAGNFDFVYDWKKEPTIGETIDLADRVHETLKDMGVIFRLETMHFDAAPVEEQDVV